MIFNEFGEFIDEVEFKDLKEEEDKEILKT